MSIHGTAQALVVSRLNGPFEVKEVQLSDDLRADELIVRMVATSVCHTDVASAKVRIIIVISQSRCSPIVTSIVGSFQTHLLIRAI